MNTGNETPLVAYAVIGAVAVFLGDLILLLLASRFLPSWTGVIPLSFFEAVVLLTVYYRIVMAVRNMLDKLRPLSPLEALLRK